MKTLKQINEHLSSNVYDDVTKLKIPFYLYNKGIKEGKIIFQQPKTFDDFQKWFEDNDVEKFKSALADMYKDDSRSIDEDIDNFRLRDIIYTKSKYNSKDRQELELLKNQFAHTLTEKTNNLIQVIFHGTRTDIDQCMRECNLYVDMIDIIDTALDE